MNIVIKTTNIELTSAISEYVQKRLGGVAKFVDGNVVMNVELAKTTNHHRQGDIFAAEVNLTTVLGKQYRATSETTDLYESIDAIRASIIREVSNGKTKQQTLFRRGAQRIKDMIKGFRR